MVERIPCERSSGTDRISRYPACSYESAEVETRESETYGAHHFWHVSQRRILAVRSGTISFSATMYSYRDTKVSHTFSGTKKSRRWPSMPKRDIADHLRFLTSLVSITSNSLRI